MVAGAWPDRIRRRGSDGAAGALAGARRRCVPSSLRKSCRRPRSAARGASSRTPPGRRAAPRREERHGRRAVHGTRSARADGARIRRRRRRRPLAHGPWLLRPSASASIRARASPSRERRPPRRCASSRRTVASRGPDDSWTRRRGGCASAPRSPPACARRRVVPGAGGAATLADLSARGYGAATAHGCSLPRAPPRPLERCPDAPAVADAFVAWATA